MLQTLINPRHLLHELHMLAQFLSRIKTTRCSSADLFLGA